MPKPKESLPPPVVHIGILDEFGLWDSVDHCWFGNKKGVQTYPELLWARAAATILNRRFGWISRIRVKLYTQKAKVHLDSLTPKKTTIQVLKEIEKEVN